MHTCVQTYAAEVKNFMCILRQVQQNLHTSQPYCTPLAWFFRTFPTNPAKVLGLLYTTGLVHNNPNTLKSYKISQKLSQKHAASNVAQSPYSIYSHGKACLSKQPPWRAAEDPRLARGRSLVRAPALMGALRVLFFYTPLLPPSKDNWTTEL